jgi:hypothetical protein
LGVNDPEMISLMGLEVVPLPETAG